MIELTFGNHNPDILTCIANLSNDEVFTPPSVANAMLDQLERAWAEDHDGENLWQNRNVTFLDPFTKSGVFLREVTRRLVDGLIMEIPDVQERVDHILTRQVFGIGITSLTALLARRSVYCSKWATSKYSICRKFNSKSGNIWFERTEHTWDGGTRDIRVDPLTGQDQVVHVHRRCSFCGAGEDDYARGEDMETHAYALIHADNVQARLNSIFGGNMHFDVVIGNPPYQLSDGGYGVSAKPIYQLFIQQAKRLDPKYLSMIVPARWYSGGKGLDEFRNEMLSDPRIAELHDFPDSRDVFPDVDVAGGICYFLWAKRHQGNVQVFSHQHGRTVVSDRPLLEPGNDIFLRDYRSISILRKIYSKEVGVHFNEAKTVLPAELQFSSQVSARKPFGLPTNYRGVSRKTAAAQIRLLRSGGIDWVENEQIKVGKNLIEKWKVFTSKASNDHAGQPDKDGTRRVLGRTGVSEPGSAVTETYILLGTFDSESEARSCFSYAHTRFFRFLVSLRSATQDITKSRFSFVPRQDWVKKWTDSDLYKKYLLDDDEISYIESTIRPMNGDER